MEEVILQNLSAGQQAFVIKNGETQLGEMVISVSGDLLTVHHTEVLPEAEGRGLAKVLLDAMVAHARQHRLRVVPRCVFVQAQFKRHPDLYADVWQNS